MDVYLMFSPTRTREYTRSPFDFDHDFFVRFTKLKAVCATLEATGPVGQCMMMELRSDCRQWGDLPYQITNDFKIWKEYMPGAWNEAIGTRTARLDGVVTNLPDKVFVALRKRSVQIWGKAKSYDQLEVVGVFSDREVAQNCVDHGPGEFIVEQKLLGIPANV